MASIRGNTEFLKSCYKIRDDGVGAVVQVNRDSAREVFAESQALVDVDTGELRDSGEVKNTKTGATIIYKAPHAAKLEFSTKIKRKNGQAFFLHGPMTRSVEPTGAKWQSSFLNVIQQNSKGG